MLGTGRLGGFITITRYSRPRDVDREISLLSGGAEQLLVCLVGVLQPVYGLDALLTGITTSLLYVALTVRIAAMLLDSRDTIGDIFVLSTITIGGITEPVGI